MSVGGRDADIWGEDDNASLYDAFARQHPVYRDTSRDLVALARLSADAAVVDLACGTGVTSREILAVLGPGGRVTGVDRSAAMLAVAARSIADPRVIWVQAPAENIDRYVTGPVDAVVCNSAIWQTDLAATAAAMRNLLVPAGRFVFNMGAGYVGQQQDPNFGDERLSPVGVMRDIAAQDYGWRPPAQALTSKRSPSSATTATPTPSETGCPFPSSPSTTSPACLTRTGCASSPRRTPASAAASRSHPAGLPSVPVSARRRTASAGRC